MVTLDLCAMTDQVELIPGGGTPLAPNEGTVSANPLGKVPCLITDGGAAIYDSRVICRYLDSLSGSGLYPSGPEEFRVLTMEATADGILDAGILAVYETRLRPEEIRYQPWVDAQQNKISRAIATLETNSSFFGAPVTAAHIAAGCALGYMDFRFAEMGWREACPKLAAWFAEFSGTPEMKATVPVG